MASDWAGGSFSQGACQGAWTAFFAYQFNELGHEGEKASDSALRCEGKARVLQGNRSHLGVTGGFGEKVFINSCSAAVDPYQWGGKEKLRPYLLEISGEVDGKIIFDNVAEVIGGKSPISGMNVRPALRALNPGSLILEIPSVAVDLGTVDIILTIPCELGCPEGTKVVK